MGCPSNQPKAPSWNTATVPGLRMQDFGCRQLVALASSDPSAGSCGRTRGSSRSSPADGSAPSAGSWGCTRGGCCSSPAGGVVWSLICVLPLPSPLLLCLPGAVVPKPWPGVGARHEGNVEGDQPCAH